MEVNSLRSGAGSQVQSGIGNRVFKQIPGSKNVRNKKWSLRKQKRTMRKIQSGVFVPKKEFEFRKLQNQRAGSGGVNSDPPTHYPSTSQQVTPSASGSAGLQDSERAKLKTQIAQLKAQVQNLQSVVQHYRPDSST